MIFRQLIHDDLSCASYLIGDRHAGVAAVVDPRLDIDEYLRLARYLGVRIEHILETHNHADHVSGHGRLAAATGASIHIHREAEAEYEHESFDDGWELELGGVRVRARAGFGSKLARLARSDQPLVLVGCDDHDALEVAALAAAVGLRNIAGYLAGGMTSWREDGLPAERVARMTVGQLHDAWSGGAGLQVLDVRDPGACASGHIPGSVHATYHDIRELPAGIDPSRPVAVICASGERAAVAASLLKRHGAEDAIHVLDGGVPLWRRQGWPIEAPAGTPT